MCVDGALAEADNGRVAIMNVRHGGLEKSTGERQTDHERPAATSER